MIVVSHSALIIQVFHLQELAPSVITGLLKHHRASPSAPLNKNMWLCCVKNTISEFVESDKSYFFFTDTETLLSDKRLTVLLIPFLDSHLHPLLLQE